MGSPAQLIGRQVGRYTITSHLASGGMAELFIARQEALGGFEKELVLKMLQDQYAEHPRVLQMFLDEARLAAKLNHQNIVHVYDVSEADGIRYIAMEYIHGETVTDIVRRGIARGGFLPVEHAVKIVADTAAGLAYAHDRRDLDGRLVRIIHRDVSPSNILVTYEGQTKIVDFGIARIQDQIREESGMRPGKVSYMSPEQVRGEPVDHRSDIFSLGIILYEITVGRRLWRGPPESVMRRIVEEQVPPPTYVRREYPPALELIVMKALEKRAANRHQSASELGQELQEFLEEGGLKFGTARLAAYMKELFAPDVGVSSEGMEKARQFGDAPIPAAVREDDDSEELDFDRRAPLVMRVEARPDEAGARGRGARSARATSAPATAMPPARRAPVRPLDDMDDSLPPLPPLAGGDPRRGAGGRARGGTPAPPPGSSLLAASGATVAAGPGAAGAALSPGSWPRTNGQAPPRTPPTVPVEARLVRGPGARATSAGAPAAEVLAADLGADLVLDDDDAPAVPAEPNGHAGARSGAGADGNGAAKASDKIPTNGDTQGKQSKPDRSRQDKDKKDKKNKKAGTVAEGRKDAKNGARPRPMEDGPPARRTTSSMVFPLAVGLLLVGLGVVVFLTLR